MAGLYAGAAIGSVVPGVGTVVGGVVGGIIGGVGAGLAGKGIAEAVNPTHIDEADNAYWRENYKTRPYAQHGRVTRNSRPPTATAAIAHPATRGESSTRSSPTSAGTGSPAMRPPA